MPCLVASGLTAEDLGAIAHAQAESGAFSPLDGLGGDDEGAVDDVEISVCATSSVLSYNAVAMFLANGLVAITVPLQMSIFAPKKAALFTGVCVGMGASANLLGPAIGSVADRLGDRKLMLVGALVVTLGTGMLLGGVLAFSLALFFCGFVLLQLGFVTTITCMNSMVAALSAATPKKAGAFASVYGIYGLVGAFFSFMACGLIFPVSKGHPEIFWCIVAMSFAGVGVVAVSSEAPRDKAAKSLGSPHRGSSPCNVLGEWFGSRAYKKWRTVVTSRFLYFFATGTFNASIIFYFTDCTDAKRPAEAMAITAVISIAGSFLAALPAGKLTDRFGCVECAALGSSVVGVFFIFMPFLYSIDVFYAMVPAYGMAQQLYNVSSMATITASLPDVEKRARDMGGWGAIQSVGAALGALFGGLVLTLAGASDGTVEESGRTRYTRDGYTAAYVPAGAAVLVSALLLLPLRHKLRATPTAAPNPSHDPSRDAPASSP